MPRAFSEREKKAICEKLVKQGYKLFAAHGLKKTSVQELAASVGISKGAFYLFYDSKEALFMDVAEQVEERFRKQVLAVIDLPGASPRARLLAVLKKAFSLVRTIPILQSLTGSDFALLVRRVPPEKLQEHLDSDRVFFQELISRCQGAGIPIRARIDEMRALVYALVLTIFHEDDLGPNNLEGTVDLLMELVAAFCVGEVEIQVQKPVSLASEPEVGYLT